MNSNSDIRKPQILELRSNDWAVGICPEFGSAILSCSFQKRDILRPAPRNWLAEPDMFKTGHFPLVPYSNRIANGRFKFGDKEILLQANRKEEAHPLHGIGWLRSWTVDDHTTGFISLSLRHNAESGTWPWSVSIKQTISIVGNALNFTLSAENLSDEAMPIGLGFHPYFANPNKLSFKADLTHIQPIGPDNLPLPSGWEPISGFLDKSQSAATYTVDNCFSGGSNSPEISWTDWDQYLVMKTSDNLPYTVIYSDPVGENFCLEPVSHINNAFNLAHTGTETGIKILKPNEKFEISMSISMLNCPNPEIS